MSYLDTDFNLPLALDREEDGTTSYLNYMPRRERCNHNFEADERLGVDEVADVCERTAVSLRNLATLIEAYGRGEIDSVRYPNKTLEQAILETKSDRSRT